MLSDFYWYIATTKLSKLLLSLHLWRPKTAHLPHNINHQRIKAYKEKYEKMIAEGLTPIKRMGQPEDIGKCVVSIAEGNFDFCTGTVIDCDGGFNVRCL
mgnify:CR=1 FL=1